MKTRMILNVQRLPILCLALLFAGTAEEILAQGSLTPPPGEPAPTMKTLDQTEPRTPISSVPFTITQPGSYYLTANLVSASSGIIIQTNRVTVDLMGFSITGDRGPIDQGVSIEGQTNAPCRNVVVRNGSLHNFCYGVVLANTQNSRIEYLAVDGLDQAGFYLVGNYNGICSGNTIAHCSALGGYRGVDFFANYVGQCNGNTVSDCLFKGNTKEGLALGGRGECSRNVFTRCMVQDNGNYGILLRAASDGSCGGNVIEMCTVSGNGGAGIQFDGSAGAVGGNRVSQCTAYHNTTYGIYLLNVRANQIERNLVSGTRGSPTWGITVVGGSGGPNLVLQNTAVGHTDNYNIAAVNTYGPIVTESGALSTTNGAAALSPWANFSR